MAKRKRPAGVTWLAILFILAGGVGLLVGFCGCLSFGMSRAGASDRKLSAQVGGGQMYGNPPPAPDITDVYSQHAPGYLAYHILTMTASTVASGALLVGGIGLLRLRPWARTLALGYAAYAAAATLATTAYTFLFLTAANEKFLEEARRWQSTYRPPGRNMVYVVDGEWLAHWLIPWTVGSVVVTLAFVGLIALVLAPRSAAAAFAGEPAADLPAVEEAED